MTYTAREVLFIPGMGSSAGYPRLTQELQAAGMFVRSVTPNWQDRSFEAWQASIGQQVDMRSIPADAVLLGHSTGGALAISEACRRPYGRLVLCSPTPTGEYLVPTSSEDWGTLIADYGGQQQFASMRRVSTDTLLSEVLVPAGNRHVLVESDGPTIERMHNQAQGAADVLGVPLTVVPDTRHDIESYPAFIMAAVQATAT